MERLFSVSLRTIARWVEHIDQARREDRDRRIRDLWLSCATQEEIADATGISFGKANEAAQEFSFFANWQYLRIPAAQHAEPEWKIPLYNIWSFGAKTNEVGHFGNSEQRIVDNLLYLSTEPFDIVVDALAYAVHRQRDRRNLSNREIARVVTELDRLKPRGGDHGNQYASGKVAIASREAIATNGKSAVETADIVGVSARTVERIRAISVDDEATAALDAGVSFKAAAKVAVEVQLRRENCGQ